ncbi:MAG: insulinase family protein, partial [Bacteroidaceae bacterium]|nr:insulinase family protein [Bacteroidaceae bacterium]
MHQQQLPRLLTLPDGLRLLIIPAQTRTAHAGILVGAGTRHQDDDQSGMAHLVEHMTFKGTRRRTATQIINRIEGVGGELNAYTGKEETVYYTTCLAEHLPRAIDLLRDIVFDSTFPPEELAREVEVVCDEIESYEDSPAELIFDDFEALLFPNMPLGRNILGDATRLRQY